MIYSFISDCDYVKIAKAYRKYIINKGKFLSLKEKIARNPNVAKLIGTPVIHTGIAVHISEKSSYYVPGDSEHNDHYVKFGDVGKNLAELKKKGLERAYLHLDGW